MHPNLHAIMQWNAEASVPERASNQIPDFRNTGRRILPSGARGPHPIEMAAHLAPGVYLHDRPMMDSRQLHMLSPPASQFDREASQTIEVQQELINNLRNDKDRLVGDKDRLMNDKDKLVDEKLRLVERLETKNDVLIDDKSRLRNDKDYLSDERDRLVGEKDRIVAEKDGLLRDMRTILEDKARALKEANDLLTSKTALWQEFYLAVEVRDKEIKQLKEAKWKLERAKAHLERKLEKQQDKNRDLARALEEYIEKDDDGGDRMAEDEAEDLPLAKPISEILHEGFLHRDDLEADVEGDNARAVRFHAKAKLEELLQHEVVPKAANVEHTSSWLDTVDQSEGPQDENRKQLEELYGDSAEVDNTHTIEEDPGPPAKRTKLSHEESDCAGQLSNERNPLPSQHDDITPAMNEPSEQPHKKPDTLCLLEKCSVILKYGDARAGHEKPTCESRAQQEVASPGEDGPQPTAEGAPVLLARLQQNLLAPKVYTIRPVFITIDPVGRDYGNLANLTPKVLQALMDTFTQMEQWHQAGRCAKTPSKMTIKGCAYMWAGSSTANTRWTKLEPRMFTCLGCYNNRRPCLVWQGSGKWDILPLSERVRGQDLTYEDDGYYIADGTADRSGPRHLWEPTASFSKAKVARPES